MTNLFDPSQRGGAIAGSGFNFQDAFLVMSIPRWLAHGNFKSVLKEGFDDIDVRFDGTTGPVVWHYQVKDHQVTPARFRKVLEHFSKKPHGELTRYILACCGLSAKLESVWRLVRELRGAAKTHLPADLSTSRAEIEAALTRLGCGKWSAFVIDDLEIEHENPWLKEAVPEAILQRFRGVFLELKTYGPHEVAVLDRLFHLLVARVNRAIRDGILLEDLERMIAEELLTAAKGPSITVHLHGWIRQAQGLPADHELDWTEHFDHSTLRVPTPSIWGTVLLPQLATLRAELDGDGSKRSIRLAGRAPLSAGLAFGHAFAEAAGYSIEVEQSTPAAPGGQEVWRMGKVDAHDLLEVVDVAGAAGATDIVVGIGVTADPRPAVESFTNSAGLQLKATRYIYPKGGPSVTAVTKETVGSFAALIKDEMRRFISQGTPGTIHLFYVGPLGLAVLLGQRLNGLGDIQCYERSKTETYAPSCRLLA